MWPIPFQDSMEGHRTPEKAIDGRGTPWMAMEPYGGPWNTMGAME